MKNELIRTPVPRIWGEQDKSEPFGCHDPGQLVILEDVGGDSCWVAMHSKNIMHNSPTAHEALLHYPELFKLLQQWADMSFTLMEYNKVQGGIVKFFLRETEGNIYLTDVWDYDKTGLGWKSHEILSDILNVNRLEEHLMPVLGVVSSGAFIDEWIESGSHDSLANPEVPQKDKEHILHIQSVDLLIKPFNKVFTETDGYPIFFKREAPK